MFTPRLARKKKLGKSIRDSVIGNCCADGSGHRDGSAASALAASSNVWSCVAVLASGSCFRGSASLPVFLAEVMGIGGRRNEEGAPVCVCCNFLYFQGFPCKLGLYCAFWCNIIPFPFKKKRTRKEN